MSDSATLADFAITILAKKAEPRLRELLAEHGATGPEQVSKEIAGEIFRRAIIETAGLYFPEAQIEALSHGLRSFLHPEFFKSLERAKAQLSSNKDAFAMCLGIDLAVVLAGFGLPVAPFDRKIPQILATPSNDLDTVITAFRNRKTAFVGYSVSDLPFYMLITDCVRTLRHRLNTSPELADLRILFERTGQSIGDPGVAFKHALILFPREAGDRISTIMLNDPSPNSGSIALFAGWRTDAGAEGAPNGGFLPVPMQFVSAAVNDLQVAFWIWRPVGVKAIVQ